MPVNVDMDSHNGLRGALSVYIVIFHLFLFNSQRPNIDMQGPSLMPLFFILSGFSLVVGYGRKRYLIQSEICGVKLSGSNPESDVCVKFDNWKFYQNRLARVMPLYYFDILVLYLPLLFVGFGLMDWKDYPYILVVNILPVTTLLGFSKWQLDGPSWTICSLLWMWLVFPIVLPRVQRMTENGLVKGITICYWLQLYTMIVGMMVAQVMMLQSGKDMMFLIVIFYTHPLLRFPVFLMGMFAGELCLRHSDSKLPWPASYLRFFPRPFTDTNHGFSLIKEGENNEISECSEGASVDTLIWKQRVTRQTVTLLSLTLLVFACDTIVKDYFPPGIFGIIWFQAIVPFAQLELAVSLTRDGGVTQVSKWFRTSIGNWLGERSMAIYLVHWPLMGYLSFMIYGKPLPYPRHYYGKCDDYHHGSDEWKHCKDVSDKWAHVNFIPLWGIPIILTWVFIFADLTYRFVEKPCREILRSS